MVEQARSYLKTAIRVQELDIIGSVPMFWNKRLGPADQPFTRVLHGEEATLLGKKVLEHLNSQIYGASFDPSRIEVSHYLQNHGSSLSQMSWRHFLRMLNIDLGHIPEEQGADAYPTLNEKDLEWVDP